jgi:hypothetical protein
MKTVTIYTDGESRCAASEKMSVLLAPVGATAGHDRQAPSGWDAGGMRSRKKK